MNSSIYGWTMLVGIILSATFWYRLARRDDRLMFVYIAALVGAFLGAKFVYLAAEGWMHYGAEDQWLQWLTGKTILGALLGGYISVEMGKRFIGYEKSTGDWFAIIAPFGIMLGRVGCLLHGCCPGGICTPAWYTLKDGQEIDRWPAVPIEMLFNLTAVIIFFVLRKQKLFVGQHFHLYLMGYGLFRFVHEFARGTPRIFGNISGYQIAALAVFVLGLWRFMQRRQSLV